MRFPIEKSNNALKYTHKPGVRSRDLDSPKRHSSHNSMTIQRSSTAPTSHFYTLTTLYRKQSLTENKSTGPMAPPKKLKMQLLPNPNQTTHQQ